MTIAGVIDGSPSQTALSGWARDDAGVQPLHIEARLDGTIVGRAITDLLRPDLGGDFGFRLEFGRPLPLDAIRDGRLTLAAAGAETPTAMLVWHPPLVEALAAQAIGRLLAPLSFDELIETLGATASLAMADPARDEGDRAAFARLEKMVGWIRQPPPKPAAYAEPLTYLATAPGSVSLDGVALIGRHGHLYLRAGSNELIEQFQLGADDPMVHSRVADWSALFRARAAALATRGVAYLQMIIPEKISVVPDFWPEPIATPSPILAGIEAEMAAEPFYLNARGALCGSIHRIHSYRKIDTHLAWRGAQLLFDACCGALGLGRPFGEEFNFTYPVVIGDLSERFPGVPLIERVELPDNPALARAGQGIEQSFRRMPPPGDHVGAHLKWINATAPIDRKVLVMGNSFFEFGAWPLSLSWWFIRAFREYEFVWAYEMDPALIEASKPDIVIAQTIERFLPRVPNR